MPLQIISVGQKPPRWCELALDECLKNLQHFSKVVLTDISISSNHKSNNIPAAKKEEADAILHHIPKDAYVIALDEKGKHFSSMLLAQQLNKWLVHHSKLTFIIGGPAGLHDSCYQRANALWSLSDLTFPHRFVKIILVEQLYRAYSILNNHPYHRE
ncbi:23S rRNA (pseudouridine(1915)-N(3))-methyltransferase RlmH [Candidatus Berkiella cookevillensis]|uniref:Ribosomal RNA large subunit methyltransferase H n=1 Tax=Candidatus Berkiella cookevillensis TaxID=437022 RepID=A0A0Q9YP34_9GAMM|nr:23S rRNA (pseudouridine(1915)-N(3))-methyltransferase RlmH [Candidatus Berkiella cookevillensis]MCS5707874.1 23S rRNA (pseudouridine(1915)-N(3))-methyltransferase RlmH [Candidatus Berkiella cookevillensis]